MSFRPPERYAQVIGEDEFEGFEARVMISPVPLAYTLRLRESGEGPAELRVLAEEFGDRFLESWNVVDENGEPVPADAAGVLTQPEALLAVLITEWGKALRSPPLTNGAGLSNGRTPAPAPRRSSGRKRS